MLETISDTVLTHLPRDHPHDPRLEERSRLKYVCCLSDHSRRGKILRRVHACGRKIRCRDEINHHCSGNDNHDCAYVGDDYVRPDRRSSFLFKLSVLLSEICEIDEHLRRTTTDIDDFE